MKKYYTMVTKSYVPDWSVTDGIREFIANALDSEAPFEYSVTEGKVELTSIGINLGASCLTLGTSENRNNTEAVGQHGEGILIGLVPILREGGSVTFYNGSVIWEATFEHNSDFNREVLVIVETPTECHKDYTVSITTSNENIKLALDNCLYTRGDLGNILEGKRGRVFDGFSGKLYVGGLFVTNIQDPKFSYDFHPSCLPLNRDRKTIESWEINKNTAILLSEVLSAKEVAQMVKDKSSSVSTIRFRDSVDNIRTECFNMFKEEYGEDAVAVEYYSNKRDLEDTGYKNVVVIGDDNYRDMIINSLEYKVNIEKIKEGLDYKEDSRSPIELLGEWYINQSAEDFQVMLDLFNKKGVKWCE